MKIGFVLDDSFDRNDGVQQYVKTLGSWLQAHGNTIHYLAGQSNETDIVHSLAKNIKIQFNGNRLTMPLPASLEKLKVLITREHYDVLHVQMPYSPVMAGKIVKYAWPNTAIVGTFHILPYGRLQVIGNHVLGWLERKNLRRFDEICFVSPAALSFAYRSYGITGAIIPNMIDISKWKNKQKKISGRIVFLGRLVPRKGCKEFILTLAALPATLKGQLDIIIAGDGPDRKMLEKLAETLGLRVVFYGYIDEADKSQFLGSAEIAVFPSLGGESFGIVLLEAMAAGAGMVIAGDNAGYRSVLGQIPNTLVDFSAPIEAAKQLAALIADKSERNAIHHAQQKLINVYDVNVVGPQIQQMHISAIAKKIKRSHNGVNG